MPRVADPDLSIQWSRRLDRFQTSKLTISEFCRSEGVSVSNFYAWRKKLARDLNPVAAKFVPVEFQNMPATAQEGIQGVHFDLPGGACMRLPADTSVLRLCQAVAAVVAVTKPAVEAASRPTESLTARGAT